MVLNIEKTLVEESLLWKNFKSGDHHAFSTIFHHYYTFLYNYGYKLTTDEDVTKDCIQELFIALWNNRENLGEAHSIRFYLLKSLRRKIIRRLKFRKKNFEYKINENYEFEVVFSIESVIINNQAQKEQQEYFFNLLNELPKRQKEAIYLKYYQNMSYEEIGEIMDVNYQSVRNFVHKAISALRSNMGVSIKELIILFSIASASQNL
jgi:RNA polymerase sigma factor (sigma-70 family)